MTGQGAAHVSERGVAVAVEVRTVNNRYFKLALRTTDGYGLMEPQVDELVRRHVRRGTVQLEVRVDREYSPEDFRINELALSSYRQQLDAMSRRLKLDSPTTLDALLALPGVVEERSSRAVNFEHDWPVIDTALNKALESLTKMRLEEGRAMLADLADNCRLIAGELACIEARAPLVAEGYRSRLTERLNKLLGEHHLGVEPADLIREVGLFAERSDISEETVRLRSHLEQFETVMVNEDSSGRKLEFITQEMFRETNTIGAKANDAEIARHVIEVKTAIERIREMIQNVE